MNDKAALSSQQFQANLYQDLDHKLIESGWKSGVSEAHGLLCGLACCGIRKQHIRAKAWLFQMSQEEDIDLIEGLYSLILSDLRSDGFEFNLLLADEEAGLEQRIESLANWCNGFTQGILHDGEGQLTAAPARVRESVDDIIEISRMEAGATANEESEKQFFEIEAYLQVAVRVVFEEMNSADDGATPASKN